MAANGSTLYGAEMEYFGESLDISADASIMAVGAMYHSEGAEDAGKVFVYEFISGDWQETATFVGDTPDAFLGTSVALSSEGHIIAMGAEYYNNGEGYVGQVMVYENIDGVWNQTGYFEGELPENASAWTSVRFGKSVSLSSNGDVLAVGEVPYSNDAYVHMYQNANGNWQQIDESISEGAGQFGLGLALSADGSMVAVGQPSTPWNISYGNGYVFQNCNLSSIGIQAETPSPICSGGFTDLSAVSTPSYYENTTLHWYDSENAEEPIFMGVDFPTPVLTENTSYWVEAETITGCVSPRQEVMLSVNEGTEPVLEFSYPEICNMETSALPNLVSGFQYGGEFYTNSSLIVDPITGAIDATTSLPGVYTVIYEIEEDLENCIASGVYQAQVVVQTCTIQRGISPNGDGLNDYFDLTGYNVRKLSIYNRHGKEVYSKADYTNEWGGQDNNDNNLPTGTYFYNIERYDGKHSAGWVYINREI